MGIYCFKISDHGVQHTVTTLHVISEADLIRIHALSSPNKCILPRSTHTHLENECENETSDSKHNFQQRHSRQSTLTQQSTCNTPLQAAYKCAATVCASPCSLVIGTQSGCTVWCTSDNESAYQWAWGCLLTPSIVSATPAANLGGACNSHQRP